jgi:hypothetical protein
MRVLLAALRESATGPSRRSYDATARPGLEVDRTRREVAEPPRLRYSGHGPLIETTRGLIAYTDRNASIVS